MLPSYTHKVFTLQGYLFPYRYLVFVTFVRVRRIYTFQYTIIEERVITKERFVAFFSSSPVPLRKPR